MTDKFLVEGPVTRVNVGRLTNAIYAFTLLLLFKNIRTPSFADYHVNDTIAQYGFGQIPQIMSFILAFILIGVFWIITYHMLHQLSRVDRHFLYLHFAGLMMLIFIPVTSHLVELFLLESFFAFLFHLNVFCFGVFLLLEWRHASVRRQLLLPDIGMAQIHCTNVRMLFIPVTAVIGMVLASLGVHYTRFIYFGTMAAFIAVSSWQSWRIMGEERRFE